MCIGLIIFRWGPLGHQKVQEAQIFCLWHIWAAFWAIFMIWKTIWKPVGPRCTLAWPFTPSRPRRHVSGPWAPMPGGLEIPQIDQNSGVWSFSQNVSIGVIWNLFMIYLRPAIWLIKLWHCTCCSIMLPVAPLTNMIIPPLNEVERGVYWNQIVRLMSVCGYNPITALPGAILLRSRSNLTGTYLGSRSRTSLFVGDVARSMSA